METQRTKAVPPLSRRHVRRPRLTRLLDESNAQAILIIAPAGYGKTALAAEWLQDRENVAWYGATAASADVAAFSAEVAEVADTIVPEASTRLRQRLRVAEAPERLARLLAELLAEDLASWPQDAWLVVDDYNLVAESASVEEFVDWLLTLSPLRVLITSRRRPKWASARRFLYGEITEVTREQLAMTQGEASDVLDNRSGETVRALVSNAEGWPAVIGLAALAASSELPHTQVSDALFRYFAEEVLRQQTREVQEFMLLASAAVVIDPANPDLRKRDAEVNIARLEKEGLLQPEGRRLFRFHPLLRSFLRQKLHEEKVEIVAALHGRALARAIEATRWDEAFDLALEMGDFDSATDVVARAGSQYLLRGRIETLRKWFASLGGEITRSPTAVLIKVELLIRLGRVSEALLLATELAGSLPDRGELLCETLCLIGQANYWLAEEEQALRAYKEAAPLAVSDHQLQRALWGAYLAAQALESDSASSFLDQLAAVATKDPDGQLRVAVGRIISASHKGSFSGAWKLMEPHLGMLDFAIDPMARSSFLAQAAYVSIARAEYERAEALASEAVRHSQTLRLTFAMHACLGYRASAEVGMRVFDRASRTLAELEKLASEYDDGYVSLIRSLVALRFALSTGKLVPYRETPERVSDAPRSALAEYYGLVALSCAAEGDIEQAKRHAKVALSLGHTVEALYFVRFSDLIAGIESGALVDPAESTARLLHAAADDEFLDAFVLAYRSYPALLRYAGERSETQKLLMAVVGRANDRSLASRYVPHLLQVDERIASLTRREHEVLALVAAGHSNAEIASSLVIAPSTAKVHVRHILEKLGVKNRLQAILLYKEIAADAPPRPSG